jgi:hypothetical protein
MPPKKNKTCDRCGISVLSISHARHQKTCRAPAGQHVGAGATRTVEGAGDQQSSRVVETCLSVQLVMLELAVISGAM